MGHGPPPGPPLPKEAEGDNLDEFDDLTIEELRSLLDNFKNLSKGEQMDLIRYMKKLEKTDPQKVKLLKQSVKPKAGNASSSSEAPKTVVKQEANLETMSQLSNTSSTSGFLSSIN